MLFASSCPARPSASNTTCSAKPIATPISSCCAMTTKPAPENGAIAGASIIGTTSAVNAAESTRRERAGTKRAPNSGATMRQELMRTNGKKAWATQASSCPDVSAIGFMPASANHPGDAFDEVARVFDQLADHPRPGEREHRGHREQLRDERQRHLVDLGRGLEDADQQADRERRQQQRCGEHESHLERVPTDGDDHFRAHGIT